MSKVIALVIGALCCAALLDPRAMAQVANLPPGANTTDPKAPFFIDTGGLDFRTKPPTRDLLDPKFPRATELPDGQLPGKGAGGNFIIGPTHRPAPETEALPGVPKGRVITFTMSSNDSVIYRPGLVRVESGFNASVAAASTTPGDPSNLIITTSRPGVWTRPVSVYIPHGYRPGSPAPFIVVGDGGGFVNGPVFTALDNLIAQGRVPAMVAITIGNGGQDAQGSQRGLEYDTMSGVYADWVEREVLPLVERKAGVRLTRDPDGRATMGMSSSGAAAFAMAWFRPDLYRRVLAYSPTFVNQQWPHNPALPGGAWEYHSPWPGPSGPNLGTNGFASPTVTDVAPGSPLIPSSPAKPIRLWFEVGDRDIFYPVPMADGMHDWVLANANMARALATKGYHYQFILARDAEHVDRPTLNQTLPHALEWLWSGYAQPARRSRASR